MHLIQYLDDNNTRAVGVTLEGVTKRLNEITSVYALAQKAFSTAGGIPAVVKSVGLGETVDKAQLYAAGRLLSPIDHPDAAHLHVTGTGLTHLGSAATRDAMHKANGSKPVEELTDSMKMFRMGLENGKPKDGERGVQPEWFYKGNGNIVARPGQPIPSPSFTLDAGEEPEMAGIYVIDADGNPRRIGFAVANEFSDHVTERINYLYLAHSKLRWCSFGPEIRVGDLPKHVEGTSRILRNGEVLWQKPFLSGEDNMSHTIANLEYHHFKYDLFCQPGDVHVHMFGTATLSFADGISTQPGDVFEIEETQFGLPLRNGVAIDADKDVKVLGLY
ncbi:AraD1 family protein [Devosia sp. MC521]|uniref:AraD1 family protein n=1 Tax=Devosia sp. MC521 TaxID=2759954 RepID=UPI0015F9F48B|nr:AraD1 family protein [Devosia sp. MC521]MBJ6986493.1 GguC protein [Devosia sp. MC521]QMW61541.1 GguC protein [Devosia sp. MC521]